MTGLSLMRGVMVRLYMIDSYNLNIDHQIRADLSFNIIIDEEAGLQVPRKLQEIQSWRGVHVRA